MTKISELGQTPQVSSSDQFVVVQGGTTYNVTAGILQGFISGSTGSSGGSQTPLPTQNAVPFIQKESCYGTVRKVSIVNGGSGWGTNHNNRVFKCIHQSLRYSEPSNSNYSAKPFLARGCEVQVSTTSSGGGQVDSLRIVMPGQLYRVGDILAISNITGDMDETSPNSTVTGPSALPQIRVDDVEPFMTGNHAGLQHMGSANPWVMTNSSWGDPMTTLTSWTNQFLNPQRTNLETVNWADGYAIEMAACWKASMYMRYSCSDSNQYDTFNAYGDGAGNFHPYSEANHLGVGTAARVPPILSSDAYHCDVMLPGTWFVGGATIAGGAQYMSTSTRVTNSSFPDEMQSVTNPVTDALWPTNRFIFNKHQLAGKVYGGMPLYSSGFDNYGYGSGVHQGINLTTPLQMTRSELPGDIADDIVSGTEVLGQSGQHGIWTASKSKYDTSTQGRSTNPKANRSIVIPRTGYENYTCGFYLINIDDLLPEYQAI
jgi:hypothetical protein